MKYSATVLSLYINIQQVFGLRKGKLPTHASLCRVSDVWASPSSIVSKGSLVPIKATLTIAALNHISMAALDTAIVDNGSVVDSHLRCNIVLAVATLQSVRGDENVEEARYHKSTNDEDDNHVHEDKAVDIGRVVAVLVEELGVGKGEDQSDSRTSDVFKTNGPDPVDLPVLATARDDIVEIMAKLLALVTVSHSCVKKRGVHTE